MNPLMMPQIAALIAQRNGQQPQQQGQQPMPQKPRAYYGSIPAIAEARKADPSQIMNNFLMAQGSNTSPVAGGGWAWADGIARALSGAAGGYFNNETGKKYAKREENYTQGEVVLGPDGNPVMGPDGKPMRQGGMQQAAAMASTPQTPPPAAPAPTPPMPSMQDVAQALGPQQPPPIPPAQPGQSFGQAFAPFSDGPQPPGNPPSVLPSGPPMAALPSVVSGSPYNPAAAPRRPLNAPFTASPTSPGRGPSANGGNVSTDALFKAVVGEEGVQNRDGTWQTSWKGAVGPAQVMPLTGEATAKKLGIKWDPQLFRSNSEAGIKYNLAIGKAYLAEQYAEFKDPAKAAAAYNAGPGAVRRAVRRANKSGGDWTNYLPSTTKDGKVVDTTAEYVRRVQNTIGASSSSSEVNTSGTTINEDVAAVGPTQVPEPQMEQVAQLSQANFVPPEVQTNRIAMAQEMLRSGNPDMVVMAQAYLDKGLDEQNAARTNQNSQQFTMGRDERGYEVESRRDAQARNFGRETNFYQNTFNAAESAAGRAQQANLASADQEFTERLTRQEQEFRSRESNLDREARAAEISATSLARDNGWLAKDPLWTTDGGRKEVKERTDNINSANDNIDKIDRFLALNKEMPTGGRRSVGFIADAEAAFGNAKLDEMRKLQRQITIGALGGLGVAISDGDRVYVDGSYLGTGSPYESNLRAGVLMKGIAQRVKEYESEYLNWRAENGPRSIAQFTDLWDAYKNTHKVVIEDDEGNPTLNENRPTFRAWISSIPQEGD